MKQGYNSRLDESLGMKHKGSHKQSMKSRRDESKAMSKKMYGHAYGGDHSMKYESHLGSNSRIFMHKSKPLLLGKPTSDKIKSYV